MTKAAFWTKAQSLVLLFTIYCESFLALVKGSKKGNNYNYRMTPYTNLWDGYLNISYLTISSFIDFNKNIIFTCNAVIFDWASSLWSNAKIAISVMSAITFLFPAIFFCNRAIISLKVALSWTKWSISLRTELFCAKVALNLKEDKSGGYFKNGIK